MAANNNYKKINSPVREYSSNAFIRLLSIVLVVILAITCVPKIHELRDVSRKSAVFSRYVNKYAENDSVKSFRNELTEEELLLDFDSDGVKNGKELENDTKLYCPDSDYDGIGDSAALKAADGEDVFNTYLIKSGDSSANQIKRTIQASKVEILESGASKALAMPYNGAAFVGLKGLLKPFIIYNYNSEIEIYSKKFKKYDNVWVMFYDSDKDEYSQENISVGSYDKSYYISFKVKKGMPTFIYYKNEPYKLNRSLDLAVLLNNYGDNKDIAVLTSGNNVTVNFFNADTHLNPTKQQILLERFADKCNAKVKVKSSSTKRVYDALRLTRSGANASSVIDELSAYDSLALDMLGEKEVKYGKATIKYAAALMNREDINSSDERKFGKVLTKSLGYAAVYDSKFRPDKNGFSFCNMNTENCKNGIGLAMAEAASNYYNYKRVPAIEGDASNSCKALNSLFASKGINSKEYSETVVDDESIITSRLKDDTLTSYLEQKTLQNYTNYFGKDKHNATLGVINQLCEKLASGKTVVAYMRNSNKTIAVVVYSVIQSTYNPNEYTLKVYDPNFPKGKIAIADDDGKVDKTITVNMDIKINVAPYLKYNAKKNMLVRSGSFTFEYGNGMDYCFGNTNRIANGGYYFGGDICFKSINDYSAKLDKYSVMV